MLPQSIKICLFSIVATFLFIAGLFYFSNVTYATSQDLHGWAWSSNIGWISFNSSDTGAGGGPYSVKIDDTTRVMSGYAWSPNIGWISFGAGDGNHPNPVVNMFTGAVSGWIRAVVAIGRTDGWDGWIELSGANHVSPDLSGNGGVTYSPTTKVFNGFAWGSDVVGWISFDAAGVNGVRVGPSSPDLTADTPIAELYVGTSTGTLNTFYADPLSRIKLTSVIRNIGGAPAGASTMFFQYLTSGNYTNLNTGTIYVESLPAGTSTSIPPRLNLRGSYYYFIINTPGTYQIRACADYPPNGSVTPESDETTNNCSSPVTIRIVPLAPSCTEDTWSCSEWSACSISGSQTRTCNMTFDCSAVVTPSPSTTQRCTYKKPFFQER